MKKKLFAMLLAALTIGTLSAADIQLPTPSKDGGMPLMQTISQRRTNRDFTASKLSQQTISDLLFAGCGVSSPDGKRTIPTALNKRDIELYLLLPEGAFRYEAEKNLLKLVSDEDLRPLATRRPGMGARGSAAVVIVGNGAKWAANPDGAKYTAVHAGAAMQNLYLYCTSQKLAAVACGSFDPALKEKLSLPADNQIFVVLLVGQPK